MINVLIVDDSAVARELIKHILSSDPEIRVMGTATNGEEAVEFVRRNRPDVVTMDVIMPKMDGYEATRRIMETNPVPIVIVSASQLPEEVDKTWRAVEAGAVAQLMKPGFFDRGDPGDASDKLLQTVKLMSQVRVIRRWKRAASPDKPVESAPVHHAHDVPERLREVQVVAVGASTGGPPVLQKILSALPGEFSAPVLLVQHISPGFAAGFVDWLNRSSALPLCLAKDRELTEPGRVYVAPDGFQMGIDAGGRIRLALDEVENGLRPAVSYLFRSVARSFGAKAIGILLTGMGRDGAAELKLMRDRGAVTIAQDQESCIVFGMPGEAVKLGAARYTLSPDKITEMLRQLVK